MLVKKAASIAITGALTLAGAAAAQAASWTWATASSYIYINGGGGYGSLDFGAADVTLKPTLSDNKVGDGRVYAHVKVQRKSDSSVFSYISSGKRSDGEATYVYMGPTVGYLDNGTGTFKYTVDLCRSVNLNDPCSEDKRKYGF